MDKLNHLYNLYFEELLQLMAEICAAVMKAKGGYFDESKM